MMTLDFLHAGLILRIATNLAAMGIQQYVRAGTDTCYAEYPSLHLPSSLPPAEPDLAPSDDRAIISIRPSVCLGWTADRHTAQQSRLGHSSRQVLEGFPLPSGFKAGRGRPASSVAAFAPMPVMQRSLTIIWSDVLAGT